MTVVHKSGMVYVPERREVVEFLWSPLGIMLYTQHLAHPIITLALAIKVPYIRHDPPLVLMHLSIACPTRWYTGLGGATRGFDSFVHQMLHPRG